MKLVYIFAAASAVTLVAAGCTTTSSSGGTGTGGYGATGYGGSAGSATGGSGGTAMGGTSAGGTSAGGTSAGGASGACTSTLVGMTCKQLGTGNQTCDTCMQNSCCTQMDTCFGDQECAYLYNCIATSCASITDPTQFQTCVNNNCQGCLGQTAQQELSDFLNCQNNTCGTQCGGGSGGSGGAPADGGI